MPDQPFLLAYLKYSWNRHAGSTADVVVVAASASLADVQWNNNCNCDAYNNMDNSDFHMYTCCTGLEDSWGRE